MLSMLTVLKSYVVFQFLLLCATSLDLSRPLAPSVPSFRLTLGVTRLEDELMPV